jgi:hypothetical protein
MNYNPYTSTTTVATHSANILVLNLATEEMKTVHRGNTAQVQGSTIWTAPIYGETFSSAGTSQLPVASRSPGKSFIAGAPTSQAKRVQPPRIRNVSNPADREGRPEASRPTPHEVTITIHR